MKRNGLLFGVLFIGMTFLFSDCKKSSGPGQSPQDAQLVKLSKTWAIKASTDGVTLDGTPQTGYSTFTLTVSGTAGQTTFGFTTDKRPPLSPWPISGTFTFGNDFATQLTRNDTPTALPITYSVTDTQLQMTFNYSGPGFTARTNNVKGNWVFTMSPN
ncbi:MAG: hypothetical protein JST14_08335 [Bacteroidetes bacterium]|nr:hypothetical protein [Bacteroidota bacterium]